MIVVTGGCAEAAQVCCVGAARVYREAVICAGGGQVVFVRALVCFGLRGEGSAWRCGGLGRTTHLGSGSD